MVVVKDVQRPDPEVLDALAASDAASVYEAFDERTALPSESGSINGDVTVCDPACTVRVSSGVVGGAPDAQCDATSTTCVSSSHRTTSEWVGDRISG